MRLDSSDARYRDAFRVPRNVEYGCAGTFDGQLVREVQSVPARHHDIEDNQPYISVVRLQNRARRNTVFGFKGLIARGIQCQPDETSDSGFIFDNQYPNWN